MSVVLQSISQGFRTIKSASVAATNGAAAISITGAASLRHHIVGIIWSYSATPTGGKITTTGIDGDQLDFDITFSGPGPVLTPPVIGTTNTTVTVTLAAGGSGVVGKLTVFYVTLP